MALLGDQLSQCLLKVNEMVVSRQTANTHALGGVCLFPHAPVPPVAHRLRNFIFFNVFVYFFEKKVFFFEMMIARV